VSDPHGWLARWSQRKLAVRRAEPIVEPARPALPSIDSLTFDSDYAPFMQAGVDDGVRRAALRKLLRDQRFNVMDGLDVYIDDYTKADPIEPALVRTLAQARAIFDVPEEPAELAETEQGKEDPG